MLISLSLKEMTGFPETIYQFFIGIFAEDASQTGDIFEHLTLVIDKLDKRQIILTTQDRVIFTERRCNMNDTCTVFQRDEIP